LPTDDQGAGMIGVSSRTGIYYQAAKLCARPFGLTLSDFQLTNYDVAAAPRDIVMPGAGVRIAKGTVAARRYEFTGFVDGEPWHSVEGEFTAELGPGRSGSRGPTSRSSSSAWRATRRWRSPGGAAASSV